VLVPALVPDVAVLHVQRADEDGRAHVWGTFGVTREAALAARQVIIVAEEIWSRERILSDPDRVLTPEHKVAAVVHQPFGAFPSPVQGYYRRHHDFFRLFHDESRTVEGNRKWLERWVLGVDDWNGFLDRVGPEVLEQIRITHHLLSAPLDYGAEP
jgi:glutaconate CoA-transferase, subunit A